MTNPRIATKEDLARVISECSLHSPHTVPLISAAYHDVISIASVARGQSVPLGVLNRARIPSVILLGDDFADGFDPGPAGWSSIKRMARWANLAIVNATSGQREHYEQFVALALQRRKLLLVETGAARTDAWLAVMRAANTPTIVMRPEGNGIHPVMSSRGPLH